MKTWSMKNPKVRLCLAVGAAVGMSQGTVRATTANLGPVTGYLLSMAILAGLAFGFCLIFGAMMQSNDSTADV